MVGAPSANWKDRSTHELNQRRIETGQAGAAGSCASAGTQPATAAHCDPGNNATAGWVIWPSALVAVALVALVIVWQQGRRNAPPPTPGIQVRAVVPTTSSAAPPPARLRSPPHLPSHLRPNPRPPPPLRQRRLNRCRSNCDRSSAGESAYPHKSRQRHSEPLGGDPTAPA